jgi:hypothetical protein
VHDGHGRFGKLEAGVALHQAWIVPLLDLAQENVGQHVRRQLQLAGLDARNVDHRHHPTHDHRELNQAGLVQLLGFEGRIGGAEINCPFGDLFDAAARPDGLVVQLDVRLLRVSVGPLRVDGIWERRAGT